MLERAGRLHFLSPLVAGILVEETLLAGRLEPVPEIHLPGASLVSRLFLPQIHRLDAALLGYAALILLAVAVVWLLPAASVPSGSPPRAEGNGEPSRAPTLARRVRVTLAVSFMAWGVVVWRASERDDSWLLAALLAAAVVAVLAVLVEADLRRGISFSLRLHLGEAAMLGCLLALAGLVMSYRLTDIPDSIWGDEGAFWETARALARGQRQPGPFEPGVYGFPLASSLYQAIFVKVFGETLWSWRFSSLVASIVSMVPLYFLARAVFDRTVAALSLVIMATLPFALAFSRLGYNNSQALLPVVATCLLAVLAIQRRSWTLFFGSGVVAGLGFYTYFADRIAVVLILALIVHAVVFRNLTPREGLIGLGLAAAATVMVGLLPTVRTFAEGSDYLNRKLLEGLFANSFYIQHLFKDFSPQDHFTATLAGVTIVFDLELWVRLLGRGLILTALSFHRTDLIEHHYISGSLGGPVISGLLLPATFLLLRESRRPGGFLVLAWMLASVVLLGMLSAFPPSQAHLIVVVPAMAIAYAYLITRVVSATVSALWIQPPKHLSKVAAAALVALLAVLGVREYFGSANRDFHPDLGMFILFQSMQIRDEETVVLVYSSPAYESLSPWGLGSFNRREQFERIPSAMLLQPGGQEALLRARVVIADARSDVVPIEEIDRLLDGWQRTSRDDKRGKPLFRRWSR